ncbi:glycine zipper domain-containing protein [Neisseria sp. CCUG12390]|uniref:glycine zipper domain-containing protein n=1 Tax=Neisseria sp. CCUG12390 TaxID=3392035 RepID=UPI003A0FC45C
MTSYKKYCAVALMSAALVLPSTAVHARGTSNQTKATLVGAAAGAVLTGALGGDGKSMLLGAAAGGLAGNAYAYHNKKMEQKDDREYRRHSREYRRYKVADHKKYKKHKRYAKARRYHRDWDDDWDD